MCCYATVKIFTNDLNDLQIHKRKSSGVRVDMCFSCDCNQSAISGVWL